jgi:glycosyltransferase involved in cell wall biosynthesis
LKSIVQQGLADPDLGWKIAKTMFRQKPKVVYFTFMPTGVAFYRDALYVLMLKLFPAQVVLLFMAKAFSERSMLLPGANIFTAGFFAIHMLFLFPGSCQATCRRFISQPFVVPNGVQTHVSAGAKVIGEENKVPHILFLSNYIENKGVLVLLQALALLKKQGLHFQHGLWRPHQPVN